MRRRRLVVLGVVVFALVAGGVLVWRGGVTEPEARARAEAEEGYTRWSGPLQQEEAERQAALRPLLGEPLAETWYVTCGPVSRGPSTWQLCDLSVASTYAVDWTDPMHAVDELAAVLATTESQTGSEVTAGESGPWTRVPQPAGATEPRGKVVAAGSSAGSVYAYPPGVRPQELGDAPATDAFPPESVRKVVRKEVAAGPGQGTVDIRRRVTISRTSTGCRPTSGCQPLLDKPAMPRIHGFS